MFTLIQFRSLFFPKIKSKIVNTQSFRQNELQNQIQVIFFPSLFYYDFASETTRVQLYIVTGIILTLKNNKIYVNLTFFFVQIEHIGMFTTFVEPERYTKKKNKIK